ncbi:hypothetical protein MIND_00033300 [Mycena indigotica]|uniref:DASH complex subunit SPC19 n=1 Tax=Mycena indigotica TaxID=2126181 RepID=A0A8H6WK08_9AGAR|nr:uncharacterized protein MIND_00033300 [Mycena indigotica]KAF7315189.1 hypothetical protein MIND_00033300 [Mycena indigotica]
MSRLSRANIKGRESIFTGAGSELYRGDIHAICPPSLEECVALMEDCCEEVWHSALLDDRLQPVAQAYEAEALLYSGCRDLHRMNKVLQVKRLFLLLREDTVHQYKTQLADEVEPPINELIELAEQGLKALQKKEAVLKTKADTMQSRTTRHTAPNAPAAQKLEARRLQQLTRQREALELEIEALEAELTASRPFTRYIGLISSLGLYDQKLAIHIRSFAAKITLERPF